MSGIAGGFCILLGAFLCVQSYRQADLGLMLPVVFLWLAAAINLAAAALNSHWIAP